MPSTNLYIEMISLIRKMHIRFSNYFSRAIGQHGLCMQHYTLMFLLINEGALQMSELAKKLSLTNPAITNLVDTLEKKDLALRNPSEDDRRVILVTITDKGKAFAETIQGTIIALFGNTFSKFDTEAQNTIKNFYETLISNFDEVINNENS